jgi:hypothetical protein
VRVVVVLDRAALEDLEVMVRHRHRGASRSEVVGHAVMWLRAKEATWLLRIKAAEERAARLAEEERRRVAFDRGEWERVKEEASVADAVQWVTGDDCDRGASGDGANVQS